MLPCLPPPDVGILLVIQGSTQSQNPGVGALASNKQLVARARAAGASAGAEGASAGVVSEAKVGGGVGVGVLLGQLSPEVFLEGQGSWCLYEGGKNCFCCHQLCPSLSKLVLERHLFLLIHGGLYYLSLLPPFLLPPFLLTLLFEDHISSQVL